MTQEEILAVINAAGTRQAQQAMSNSPRAGKDIKMHTVVTIERKMTEGDEPKQFYSIALEEAGGKLGAQSKAYNKAIFVDTHDIIFKKIAQLETECIVGTGAQASTDWAKLADLINNQYGGIEGSEEEFPVDEYTPWNRETDRPLFYQEDGKTPGVSTRVRTFALAGESIALVKRNATRRLKWTTKPAESPAQVVDTAGDLTGANIADPVVPPLPGTPPLPDTK